MTHHASNIRLIFDALEVGLDEMVERGDLHFSGVPECIDPDKFNRALVTIDGTVYTVSVFRPASAPVEGDTP